MGLIKLKVIKANVIMLILVFMFSINSTIIYASDTVYIGNNVLVRVVYLEATYTSKDLGVCGVTYVRVGMDTGTKIKLPKGYPMPEPQVIVEQSKLADEYITNVTAEVLSLDRDEFRVSLVHDGRTIYVAIIIPESRNILEYKYVGYKYLEMIQDLQKKLGVVLVIYVYPVPDQLYSADLETVKTGYDNLIELLQKKVAINNMIKRGMKPEGPPEAFEIMHALDNMGENYVAAWYSREPPYAVFIDIAVNDVNNVKLEDIKRFVKAVRSAIGCNPPLDIAIFKGWYVLSTNPQSGNISTIIHGNILARILQEGLDISADSIDNTASPDIRKEVVNAPQQPDNYDVTEHGVQETTEMAETRSVLDASDNLGLVDASNYDNNRDGRAWVMLASGMAFLAAAVLIIAYRR